MFEINKSQTSRNKLIFLLLGLLFLSISVVTKAGPSTYLNFQARLLSNTGSLVEDGNYHVEFKLYDVSTGGSSLWTETHSTGNLVRVANGYMSVQLGSITSFPSTIDWSQELWLTVNIGGTAGSPSWDGEMNPRMQVTAVPYAFKANEANSLTAFDSGNSTTVTIDTPTGTNNITLPDASGEVCLTSGNCAGTGGVGDILNNGQSGQVRIGSNDASSTILETNNVDRLTIDSSGAATFSGSLTVDTTSTFTGLATFDGNLRVSDGSSNYATITTNSLAGDYNVAIPTITTNDTFCLASLGNCVGTGGGGAIGGGGTLNRIALFTPDGFSVGDSSLVETGTGSIIVDNTTNSGEVQFSAFDGAIELLSGNDAGTFIDFKGSANLATDYQGRILYSDGSGFDIRAGGSGGGVLYVGESGTTTVNNRANSADIFRAQDNGSTAFVVADGGNVGIGAASPSAQLTVDGGSADPSTNKARLLVTNSSTNYGPEIILNNTGTGGQDWRIGSGQSLNAGGNGQGDFWIYNANSGQTRLLIQGSDGNVGIGDTSPAALLTVGNGDLFQVNSSGAIAAATGITSSGTISFTSLVGGAGDALCLNGSNQLVTCTVGAGGISGSGTANQVAYFNGTGSITSGAGLAFDGSDLNVDSGTLFVDASTNRVGIGMTSPDDELHVYGDIPTIRLEDDGGISEWQIGSQADGDLYVYDVNAGARRLTVDNSGNVGIGTTSTGTYKLNVAGSTNSTTLYQNGNQVCDTSGNCVGTGGSGAIGGGGTLNTIALFTPDGNNIGDSLLSQSGSLIISSGDLQISGDDLYVGDNDINSGIIRVYGNASGSEGAEIQLFATGDYDTTFESFAIDVYQDDLRIFNNGITRFWLDGSTGNVGIGNNVSGAQGRLQVTGDEVRIGSGGTVNTASGDGDLYVQDNLEVDGYSTFLNYQTANLSGTPSQAVQIVYTDASAGTTTTTTRSSLYSNYVKSGSGTYDSWPGSNIYAKTDINAGIQDDIFGVNSRTQINGGTITNNVIDFNADAQYGSSGSVGNRTGLRVIDFNISGTQTLSSQYGIYVNDLTSGSSDYGIRIDGADTQALWVGAGADNTDAANGIAFGSSRDTNLYRAATNLLATDDSFQSSGSSITTGYSAQQGRLRISDGSSNFGTLLTASLGSDETYILPDSDGNDTICLEDLGNCSGGSSLWTQTGSDIYYNTGNVGIGDSSPAEASLVVRDTTAGEQFAYFRNDTDASDLTIDSLSGGVNIRSGGGDFLRLTSNASETTNGISITSSGDVGIGTTSPTAILDVRKWTGGTGSETFLNLGYDGVNPSRIKLSADNWNGQLSLYDSGNSEDVRISTTSGGDTWFNSGGNVGIGTTSTGTYKLNVAGSTNSTTLYQNGNQVCDTSGNCVGTGGSGAIGGGGTLNTIALFTPDGNNIGDSILTQSGDYIALDSAGSPASQGIFIQDPSTSNNYGAYVYFDDAGNELRLSGLNNSTEYIGLRVKRDNGSVAIGDGGTINSASGNGDLYVEDTLEVDGNFHNSTGTSWAYFNGAQFNNEIGFIGTAGPTDPQIDFGSGGLTGFYSSATNQVELSTNGVERLEVQADGDIAFDTNTLFVDAVDGQVGIGTATPDYLLEVNGTVDDTSNGRLVNIEATSNSSTNTQYGLFVYNTIAPSATASTIWPKGAYIGASSNSANIGLANIYGLETSAIWAGSVTAPSAFGLLSRAYNTSTGTLNSGIGAQFQVVNSGSGTIANANTIVAAGQGNATGTITTSRGLLVYNQNQGNTAYSYGIQVSDQTGSGTAYGIKIDGADNYALWVDNDTTRLDGAVELNGLSSSSTEDTLVVLNASNQLQYREYSDFLSDNNVINGAGSSNRVAYWTDVDTLTNSANFTYNGSTLDVNGNAQFGSAWNTLFQDGNSIRFDRNSTNYIEATDAVGSLSFGSGGVSNRAVLQSDGDIDLGSGTEIDFYDATGDKILWYQNTYGTGVESSTLTNWSNSQFRWRIGGTSVSSGTESLLLDASGLTLVGTDNVLNLGSAGTGEGDLKQVDEIVGYNDLRLAGNGSGGNDIHIDANGDVSIGTNAATTYKLEVQGVDDRDQFYFYSPDGLTGEKDVFTIVDADAGGGSQDESSTLKVLRSGAFSSSDDGSSVLEVTYSGGGALSDDRQFYALGRTTDEGAVQWGISVTDSDFWTTGAIRLGATGTDCAGTGAACFSSAAILFEANGSAIFNENGNDADFRVESDTKTAALFVEGSSGNVGIGTATPAAWAELDVAGDVQINNNLVLQGQLNQYGTGDSWFTGNLGIGLTAPDNLLEVRGSGSGADIARIKVSSSDNQASIALASDDTGDVIIYSPDSSDDLRFFMGGSDRFMFTSGGDLQVTDGLSLYANAVSDNTVEAAKFCTGDGETNCVTSFSALGAGNTKTVTLVPEYIGMTLVGDGSSNNGTMTSDYCSNEGALLVNTGICASGQSHNYMSWTTSEATAQDYDIYIRYQMPSDFASFTSSSSINIDAWRTDSSNSVTVSIYDDAGALCGSTTSVATGTGTWSNVGYSGDETTCGISANEEITIKIKMTATNAEFARAGEIRFSYTTSF